MRTSRWANTTTPCAFEKMSFLILPPQLPILRVSHTTSHPLLKSYRNCRVDLRIDLNTKSRLQSICRRCNVTAFHFYLLVFRVLLSRYSDVNDVAIGIGDANMSDHDKFSSIGPYINLLPLRFQTQIHDSFKKLLEEIRLKTYSALANSRIPFQVLLNEYVINYGTFNMFDFSRILLIYPLG